jgi:hypothetical protein
METGRSVHSTSVSMILKRSFLTRPLRDITFDFRTEHGLGCAHRRKGIRNSCTGTRSAVSDCCIAKSVTPSHFHFASPIGKVCVSID